ncbi:general stress protein [Paenibacillus oenotherae]|uniref:General stress protein n=1 Tax=Paenibacillus oenotherae TaxID=1435645 RepID=A0ABS7D405_9BACL|nr:general stress protein [Paenibacillus oenotherae]MBW7474662.1 general stress protein [Paenibacillus oenotherae]
MAIKLGIFQTEQQVIHAIETLEQEGFTRNELKVLVKDSEHSRRIERQTDVHADELRELVETRSEADDKEAANDILFAGTMTQSPGGVYGAGVAGMMGSGAPYGGMNLLAGRARINENSNIEEALISLGLNGSQASLCRDVIVGGGYVVGVETGAGGGNGGPDPTRSGIVEAVYRHCGAERIL